MGNTGKVGYGCWCALRPLELLGSFLEALWGTSLGKLLEKLLGALAGLVPGSLLGSAAGYVCPGHLIFPLKPNTFLIRFGPLEVSNCS